MVPSIAHADRPSDRAGFDSRRGAPLADDARGHRGGSAALLSQPRVRVRSGSRRHTLARRADAAQRRRPACSCSSTCSGRRLAGADPVTLLRQYKGRVASLHLKDKDPSAGTSLVESAVARTAFVEVGSGALDFPGILGAAREAGVRHYFVEQDQTPGDPIESLKKSYAYLAALPR